MKDIFVASSDWLPIDISKVLPVKRAGTPGTVNIGLSFEMGSKSSVPAKNVVFEVVIINKTLNVKQPRPQVSRVRNNGIKIAAERVC